MCNILQKTDGFFPGSYGWRTSAGQICCFLITSPVIAGCLTATQYNGYWYFPLITIFQTLWGLTKDSRVGCLRMHRDDRSTPVGPHSQANWMEFCRNGMQIMATLYQRNVLGGVVKRKLGAKSALQQWKYKLIFKMRCKNQSSCLEPPRSLFLLLGRSVNFPNTPSQLYQ